MVGRSSEPRHLAAAARRGPRERCLSPPVPSAKLAPRPSTAELLALLLVPGAGAISVARIMAVARLLGVPLGTMLGRPVRDLLDAFPPGCQKLAGLAAACSPAVQERAAALLSAVAQRGIQVVSVSGTAYPASVLGALGAAAPPVLFLYGGAGLLGRCAAGIVGTRRPTPAGRLVAEQCARTLVEAGVPVVSGGAQGIDAAAHESALRHGGATVIVLPQGLLAYSMPSVYRAAAQEGRLLLVSGCMPAARWQTHAAVARNATISALSRLLCVIEPRRTGGSLATAGHSLARGVHVLYAGLDSSRAAAALQAGAGLLLDSAGSFDPARLLACWRLSTAPAPRQTEISL